MDLARPTLTRLTFDPGSDSDPVWTPDGQRIIFSSSRAGARNLYWQAADGTGAAERLTTSAKTQWPTSISPDGTGVIFCETGSNSLGDIGTLLVGPQRRTESSSTHRSGN